MKWRKIGKIFDPTTHPDFSDYVGFAQSPQALVLDDRIRIYFSIRKADDANKFLSFVSFIDFNFELTSILATSKHEVIKLGGLGSFDEHGIFPFSPFLHENKVYAYTCGWSRRVSVPVETSTGLAISHDNGFTFQKYGTGPVLSSSLDEPCLVGDSFVRVYDGVFHMWYIFGVGWKKFSREEKPERIYKIAHATSRDGIEWKRDARQIIADKLNNDECQALPTVIQLGSRYHMFFCYRYATGFRNESQRSYRIGYAYSDDLIAWIRDDDQVGIETTAGSWDSNMLCYPNVFACHSNVYLLYNGSEFGKYGFGAAVLEK